MAEGKKRLFYRSTVLKTFKDLYERVKHINEADLMLNIKDIIVFGSFINTTNEMIHDLDVCFTFERNTNSNSCEYHNELQRRMEKARPAGGYTFLDCLFYDVYETARYLRGHSSIISVHDVSSLDAALYQIHIYLMKDGKILDTPEVELGTAIKIENRPDEISSYDISKSLREVY